MEQSGSLEEVEEVTLQRKLSPFAFFNSVSHGFRIR
jgi:hypothetical protein